MDFDGAILKSAGVQPRHVHRLIGVSRVTASNWLRGQTKPHALVRDKAELLMSAVSSALNDERLPISDSLPPDERSFKTAAIIKRYMDLAQQAPNDESEGVDS